MGFIRTKCLFPECPAMACPSATGYCSYHDLQRTPLGQKPGQQGQQVAPTPDLHPWLENAPPITRMVQ